MKISTFSACSLSSTFGSGFFPVAPGTVGALVAILVLWFLPPLTWAQLLAASGLFYLIGVWAAGEAEGRWGEDAGKINWDEVVGQMVSVLALPKTASVYVAAFVFFRIFDIAKPYPIRLSEKLSGGWGVMTDDVIAGLYANIGLQILFRVII